MDQVIMQTVQLWQMIQDNLDTIGGVAGFGALFAVVIQVVKTKFRLDERVLRFSKNIKINGKGLVNALLIVITLLATVLETALQLFDVFPNAAVALPAIYLGITQAHRIIVSPLFAQFRDQLQAKAQVKAKAQAYDELITAQQNSTMPAATANPTPVADTGVYNPINDIGR